MIVRHEVPGAISPEEFFASGSGEKTIIRKREKRSNHGTSAMLLSTDQLQTSGAEAQRDRGTEEQRRRGTEEQRDRGTEAQRNRGTEAQRNRGTKA